MSKESVLASVREKMGHVADAFNDVIAELDVVIQKYQAAFDKMREATYTGHSTHWDSQGNHGATCPACMRARELREEAERMLP